MTTSMQNRRFSYLGTLTVAALGLAAVTVPLNPAKAQIGVQVGPFGFGVGAPYPYPYPYAYYPRARSYVYYGPGYYRGYYPGYYYGYPY